MLDGAKNKITICISTVFIVTFLISSGCLNYQDKNEDLNIDNVNNNIENDKNFCFNYPPFELEKVAYIIPMGCMIGSHVTPIDHQYYVSYDFDKGEDATINVDVYSPGDGVVTQIQHMNVAVGDTPLPVDDFRLVIQHSNTISSIFIHIDELSDKLKFFDPGLGEYKSVKINVNAGEIIGRYGGSVDYNIVDEEVVLPFINASSYEAENWKIHCPDPFNYFNDSIKEILIEKCLRSQDPIGGKICYDVEGKLVGTWFKEGTNGYKGINPNRYWADHLSIAYDSIDPDAIIISIGTYIDSAKQFSVKNNIPNPADISFNDGLIKYELVDFQYYKNDSIWDRNSLIKGLKIINSEYVQGVLLLQLLENGKLKMEIFPDLNADEVTGFKENAVFYIR
jgi:hypothetical protein